MKRFLLLPFFVFVFAASQSQNLSYTCPQDVILGCNSACFTLTAQFPDIRAVGDNYTLKNVSPQSICRPYVDPGTPGPSTNLTVDDYYSNVIPIGFTFLFYGQPHTSLVASTNGYLSFDITNANGGAAWTLTGNVPSTTYDKGLVMGPWHDLDPNPTITTSPTEQIKYNLVGTAPNRKWVLSFYRVPLFTNFGGGCNDSIYNTHQIVLHETTGVIEVFIQDKQLCPAWNSGKAMVGLQDMTQTKGIVPPGRGATDPPWGAIGMNEVWRFIPTGGAPLYRSVELLDATGAVVATGDTTRVDVNTFTTSFPNVCPPAGASIYVVKTTYQSLADPTTTTFSLDTINVIRQAALPVTATSTPTTCGASTGTVTVTASGTPTYQYSIDGGALQPSPVFTGLAVGTHNVYAVDATGCNNTIPVVVGSISALPSTVTSTNPSCTGINDANITVTPTAGVGPYTYSIDGGVTTQPTGIFPNLGPGIYTITFVDVNLCSGTTASITISPGTALQSNNSHTNTSCNGATDGTITVIPVGAGTYSYTISPVPASGPATNATGIFTNLAANTYTVTFTNATGCSGTTPSITVTVGGSILATWCHVASPTCVGQNETCPGANDGVIVVTPNTAGSYTFTMSPAPGVGSATNTTGIFAGISPGIFYNVSFVNATGCTGSMTTLFVAAATGLSATAVHTDVTCPGANDGTVTLTPTPAGTYNYTLNPGGYTSATGTFTGLPANTYSAVMSTLTGSCSFTVNGIVVSQGAGLVGTASPTATSCLGANNGGVTITPPIPGTYSYTITPAPVSGPATNTTGIFSNLAPGNYSVAFSNAAGCTGTVPNIIVVAGAALTANASPTATSCQGANNGGVTITPTIAGAYSYTITPAPVSGPATNTTGIFTNLAANTYSVSFSNAAGCSATVPNIVVAAGSVLTANSTPTATSCQGANNGGLTVTPVVAGAYTFTISPAPVSGPATNTTGIFSNLAANTYSVSFTNAVGCSGTVANIVVLPGAALAASAPLITATSCQGADDGAVTITPTIAGAYTYIITPAPVSGPATNTTGIFSNLAAGTYSVSFSNAAGCSGTVANIVVNAGPSLAANAPVITATSCQGANDGAITISPVIVGPHTFVITPAPVSGPATNATGIFTNLAAGTYSVTFSNTTGCAGTVANIVVNAGPSLAANPPVITGTSCQGANDAAITVNPIIPAVYSFTITPAPVTGPATNSTGVFSNLAAGTYSVTFTNVAGCAGTAANIIVAAGPALAASMLPINTTCPGVDDGSITVTPGIAGSYTFTITPAPVTGPATNTTGIFTNLAPGSYSITMSNAATCSSTFNNINVIAGAGPVGAANTTSTSCPTVNDGTITLSIPAGTGGPYSFTITGPSGTFTQSGPSSTTFSNLAPGSYTATFISSAGCSGAIAVDPVVATGPYLTSTFSTFNPPCSYNDDGTITIIPGASSVSPFAVVLTGPGGPYNLNSAAPVFTNLAAGAYNYSFTDANGCTGVGGPVTLTTHAPLAIGIVKTMPLCYGNADGIIVLSASGGLAPYQYALSPFSSYQTGTFNGLAQGSYTFRIRDAAGCTKDTTITLNQPTQLTASAVTAAGTCNGNDGQILVTGNAGTPVYTYSLDGINYQAASNFVVSGATAPGAVYANITVKDNNGCVANAPTVYVGLIDNMSPLLLGNDTSICAEQQITFQPQVSPQANVFTWSTIPDPSIVSTLDNNSILNATASPLDTTTYVLNAQWGVCSRVDTITVNLLHKPIANAGQDTAVCFDKQFATLHGTATNLSGTVNYEWSDTTNLSTPHSSTTAALPQGTETFILTVTDNYGCNFSVTDEVVVAVQPPVPAFAGNDTTAVIGEPHQLHATGGVSYMWSPATPLNSSNIQNPLATLDHDQLFEVTVTDVAGCVGTDRVYIQVYPPGFHLPNAFTPNGDGLNDVFRVIPAGIAYTEWFRIFNRYGQLVFQTNQYLKGWDGTFQGKKQPIGNYVWILKGVDKNNRVIEMKGTVLLVQ
ncbi:MAG: gliding motility-associated C-terminal domain-containing protein [Ferruginibacter sp.]